MSLDMYKVPRQRVDVEALAQEFFRYLRITAEDTEYLSYDPTRRDKVFAELYKLDGVKSDVTDVEQFVAEGDDPDKYLIPVNAEIKRLGEPKTFEDRALRLHLAVAAFMVWQQYKFYYALADHDDLVMAVLRRKTQLLDEWLEGDFERLFPERATGAIVSTPPTHGHPLTPPATRRSGVHRPKTVTTDDAVKLLNEPGSLVGRHFVHISPDVQGQDDNGTWRVISYSVRIGEGEQGVVHEYQVVLEAFGAAPIPMLREEVHYLLVNSKPVM